MTSGSIRLQNNPARRRSGHFGPTATAPRGAATAAARAVALVSLLAARLSQRPPGIFRYLWGRSEARATSAVIVMDSRAPSSTAATVHIPPFSPAASSTSSSPFGPLTSDFVRQQAAKQERSNYHSTSLKTMVAASVNPTRLHPTGVQYVSAFPRVSLLYLVSCVHFPSSSSSSPLAPHSLCFAM